MPINIDEINSRLTNALEVLNKNLPSIIDVRAGDSIALIKNRFIQKGLKVDNSGSETSFPAYSDQYEKKREKKGLNVTPNRLVFTGDMLRKLRIVERRQTNTSYSAIVGGGDNFSQDKIDYNSEHYGDILKLSKQEEQLIKEVTEEEISNLFNRELQ